MGRSTVVKVRTSLTCAPGGTIGVSLKAVDVREEAKRHYGAGRFFAALECYSECIQASPAASLHCNRALTFMSLYKDARVSSLPEEQQHAWRIEGLRRALGETSVAALRLDPECVKAFYLTGIARLDLGRLDLSLEPKERLTMLQMAVETLEQASEASVDQSVQNKVDEAVKELEKTLKDMEQIAKNGKANGGKSVEEAAAEIGAKVISTSSEPLPLEGRAEGRVVVSAN